MSAIDWATVMTALQNWVVEGSSLPATAVIWKYGKVARPPNSAPFVELSITDMRQVAHDYTTTQDNPFTFTDLPVTVDVGGNRMTATAHPFSTGDGPFNVTAVTTEPAPVVALTKYWTIKLDANHFRLATTFRNAMAGTPITFTTVGVGTIKVVETPESVQQGKELIRTSRGIRQCTMEMQCFAPEGSVYLAQATLTDVIASLSLHVDELIAAGIGISDLGVAYINGGVRLLEGHRGSILEPRAIAEVSFYLNTALSDFVTYIESALVAVKPNSDAGELPEIDLTMEHTQ